VSFSFRVRRIASAASNDTDIPVQRLDEDGSRLFLAWQSACADLRAAEQRGDAADEILELAVEVIRARNAMTRAQMTAGWIPSPDDSNALERDELVVREADERNL
jgi:hypothetical protein